MSKPAAFQATYSDWRLVRTRKCVQLVFEVPVEQADLAYEVLGGMPNPAESVWCAVARLKGGGAAEESKSIAETSPAPVPDKPPGRAKSLAQQAGMWCSDARFQKFLSERCGVDVDAEEAAKIIRQECQVESRKDIIPDTYAGEAWKSIMANFMVWRDHPELV